MNETTVLELVKRYKGEAKFDVNFWKTEIKRILLILLLGNMKQSRMKF